MKGSAFPSAFSRSVQASGQGHTLEYGMSSASFLFILLIVVATDATADCRFPAI